jgi:hypothetical protein
MLESPKIPSSADLFSVDELRVLDEVGLPYGSAQEARYARSFLERLRVNSATRKNRYWVLPYDNKGHEDEVQVGRGVVTSDFCGRWLSDFVCKNIEGHRGKMVGGVDCTDKMVVRHKHMYCHKPSCPICFDRGWATREAKAMAGRIEQGVKCGFGNPEHITVSVSIADRDLPESILRKRTEAVAFDRGVEGFGMIYHAARMDRTGKKLVRKPHFHLLGFVTGGFDRCRNCSHGYTYCKERCDGLKGREIRGYARDGYIVKVHDVRKTIEGTAKYQLNHSTMKLGVKRHQVVVWCGTLSCRKFKSSPLPSEDKCVACGEEMVRSIHVGKGHVVRDVGSPDYLPVLVLPELDEDGNPNYIDFVGFDRYG